ncbi:zinc finger CCCH domain-containing protein 43-like [Humulus lupulus]|uniref:zinc finger CCCH domain-containing protein 43-like n=1 Tax=Humulus lupulus TaxID=3486 RepID=UPI002B41678F|nr:zinc finger CCCH domain-containing protein 43-like [Humulus lupulus]
MAVANALIAKREALTYQSPSSSSSSNNNGDPDPETSVLDHGAVEKEKEEEVSGASIHQELARLELKENEEEPVLKPDLEEKKEKKEEEKDEEKVVDRDLSGEEMGSRNGSDDGNENVNEDGYGNGNEDEDEDRKREAEEKDDEDGGVGENKSGNETENGSEVNNGSGEMDKKNRYGGGIRKYQYPVRPEAEDCLFYLKTRTCKFGSNCKFNHPVRKRSNQGAKEKVKEREESTENHGQSECKVFIITTILDIILHHFYACHYGI